ncbi:hypothetical protein [Leclercia adecarboxylata]|uniref:hypothetical protein n=1 Tax=Leclercia adecarboxylata TaxID=83655 RepID=UPI003D95B385
MNLNAKRQGAMPFSFAKPSGYQSTITELQGLLESHHLACWIFLKERTTPLFSAVI